jgi:putative ABC transport system permease protein
MRNSVLPRAAKILLWLFLGDEDYDQAVGDFEEHYRVRIVSEGPVRARTGFWCHLLKSLPAFVWDSISWRGVMIRENLRIAWRILKKQKIYSLLNITGLGVSLACLLLILFHVKGELGYETGFPKADRIYRVQTDSQYGSTTRQWAASAPAMGPELERFFPEIEATARFTSLGPQILVYRPAQGPARRFEESRGYVVDPAALSMFDLEFVKGNPATALEDPATMVLTSSFARKYFGDDDPMAKTLFNETRGERPLQVTGVIRDIPDNTHLKFDFLVSMPTFVAWTGYGPEILNHRTWKAMYTYVLLRPGQSPDGFDAKAAAFMKDFHAENPGRVESIRLQPIRRIHLHSKLEGEAGPNGDIAYVLVFSGAALLILLIAVVNFVNLATAQSFKRSKEIGVRKVVGARRGQLVRQHLGESALMTVISAGLAVLLLNLSLPFYGGLTEKSVTFGDILTPVHAAFLFVLLAVLSLLAGLYPALFVSGFRPIGAIGGVRTPRSSAVLLRKGLVVFQFVISVFLIFSTVVMSSQLDFFHRVDLGFNRDSLIAVKIYGDFGTKTLQDPRPLKEEIRRHSGVTGVALTSNLFGTPFSNERLTPVGTPDKDALSMLRVIRVDEDFVRTAGLTLVRGRDFDAGSDRPAYIVSESTVAALGLEEPLGVECLSDVHGGQAPIVGVIRDFHFASLHSPIEPLVLEYLPRWTGYLLVGARTGRVPEVLEFLKRKTLEVSPDFLFAYEFVDEVFGRNYRAEDRSYDLFKVFSALALFVACLGLFGLAVYAAESRVKEIGIRKTLGAPVGSICLLLSGSFLRWVLLANVIALPAAYWAMSRWLRNFAFHTDISAWTFVAAGGVVLFFAVVTVGSLALKSARENPVESLRYE